MKVYKDGNTWHFEIKSSGVCLKLIALHININRGMQFLSVKKVCFKALDLTLLVCVPMILRGKEGILQASYQS